MVISNKQSALCTFWPIFGELMSQTVYNFTIQCQGISLGYEDEEDAINSSYVTAWDEACSLPERLYPTQFGTVVVKADWRAAGCVVQNWYANSLNYLDFAPVKISVHSRGFQISDRIARDLARIYLCDFFIIMNIAAPGCCSLPLSEIHSEIPRPEKLYGEIFSFAWIDSIRSGWPLISKIPVALVWDWLFTLRGIRRLIAESPAERALSCLLHIAAKSGIGPEDLIWVAHGLEAIYGSPSPPLEILRGRVAGFLKLPEDSRKMLQKGLRSFYDLRNAFAHGGFHIPHIISNELLDPEIEKQRDEIIDNCNFVLRLVVATLQEFARADLQALKFQEIPTGVPCSDGT